MEEQETPKSIIILLSKLPEPILILNHSGWDGPKRDVTVAKNIQFRSNEFQGFPFDMDVTDQHHSYSVYWTLNVKVLDKNSNPLRGAEVRIMDKDKKMIVSKKIDANGYLKEELLEYSVDGPKKMYTSPYTLVTGKIKKEVTLNKNSEVVLQMKR